MPITNERFIEILELAWPSYQENVDKVLDQYERGEWFSAISDRVEIPFMCWHINQLDREGKITAKEQIHTKYKIMQYFVGDRYRTVAGMLVNQYNLKQDTPSKVLGARAYWIHVVGLYKMYGEFPPNRIIVAQMKENHAKLFEIN